MAVIARPILIVAGLLFLQSSIVLKADTGKDAGPKVPPACASLANHKEALEMPDHRFAACLTSSSIPVLKSSLDDIAYGDAPDHGAATRRANQIFVELERRNAAAASDWRAKVRIAYVNWEFEELARLSQSKAHQHWFEDKELPSKIIRMTNPSMTSTAWEIDVVNNALRERPLETATRPLLVIFSPTCNPCRRAAVDIEKDAELKRIFATCSLWLSPLDQSFSMRDYAEWNRLHPALNGLIVKHWERLAMPFPVVTPTFHAFDGGQSIFRLDGWPPAGRKQELVALAQQNPALRSCLAKT